MKKNAPYEIDWTTNTIKVSKRFMEASTIIGQGTYNTMLELRKLNMPVVVREIHRKKTGRMWSFEHMEYYLDHVENGKKYWEQYIVVKGKNTPRATVWAWFKRTFPYCQQIPVFNDENEYIVLPEIYTGRKTTPIRTSVEQSPEDTKNKDSSIEQKNSSAGADETCSEDDAAA